MFFFELKKKKIQKNINFVCRNTIFKVTYIIEGIIVIKKKKYFIAK